MTATQLVDSLYQAFSRGDISYIVNQIASGASFRQPKSAPWGGDYSGPEGAAEFFTRLNDGVQTTGFAVTESVGIGNRVFSFGTHEAIIRTTGKPISIRWMFDWRVENGKVTNYEAYYDAGAIVAALS